jgi:HTH-type transcriptional regulator, glycine betaine synthesis regulator
VLRAESSATEKLTAPSQRSALRPLEVEVIDLFVGLSRALGQPQSIGEIFGLLFISPQPLAMDDVMERLKLSKGSASQGLKFLRNLSAIRPVYVPGERRVHYHAEAGLRTLAGNFIRDKLAPHLGNGADRLTRLTALLKNLPSDQREHASCRINTRPSTLALRALERAISDAEGGAATGSSSGLMLKDGLRTLSPEQVASALKKIKAKARALVAEIEKAEASLSGRESR